MKDEWYNEWVERENKKVSDWIAKGNSIRKIDNYQIEIRQYPRLNNYVRFRVHGRLEWFTSDWHMTLQDLAQQIADDIPYIKSVKFVRGGDCPSFAM